MTQLIVEIPEEEHARLLAMARQTGHEPGDVVLRLIRRALAKWTNAERLPFGTRVGSSRSRTVARSARQFHVVEYVRQHGPPKKAQADVLAAKLDVAPRTIYRDVQIALEVLQQPASSAAPDDTHLAAQSPGVRARRTTVEVAAARMPNGVVTRIRPAGNRKRQA